jgi:hypothetical protein
MKKEKIEQLISSYVRDNHQSDAEVFPELKLLHDQDFI